MSIGAGLLVLSARAVTLPNGTPVMARAALLHAQMGGEYPTNARLTVVAVTGPSFTQALRVATLRLAPQPWNTQVTFSNTAAVRQGDVLFLSVWARRVESRAETGEARAEFVFEQGSPPWTKSAMRDIAVGPQWQQFYLPFTAAEDYAAGQAQVCFRVGYPPQVLELAAFELLNCGVTNIMALPMVKATYAGMAADAPWRAAAAARINKLRKAALRLVVLDTNGQPLRGAAVQVRMRKHAFGFGAAVVARYFTADATTPDAQRYRTMVTQLFNKVVLENDLKWPNWCGEWNGRSGRTDALAAVAWLRANGIAVRGHCLVWPSWDNTPQLLRAASNAPARVRQIIAEHIHDEVGALRGNIVDWDVINEPFSNHDVMDMLGNAVMAEWFKEARAADPAAKLYLNDYSILSARGLDTAHQDHYFATIQYLLQQGAPLDGIGVQSHFGWDVTPPQRLLEVLDRFAVFHKEIQATEFDISMADEQLQARYLADFMTTLFSHPAVAGIVMWGFWEGAHWRPEAALFRRDWSVKPVGKAWQDLVFKQWWTNARGQTDAHGGYAVRGFKGDYEVTVSHGGLTNTLALTLTNDLDALRLRLRKPLPPGVVTVVDTPDSNIFFGGQSQGASRYERVAVTGQPFADAARLVVDPADTKEFGVVLNVRACAPVRAGDVLAATFFVRRADAAADEGVFWFSFEEAREPYDKSVRVLLSAPAGWQRHCVVFRALREYAAGQSQVSLHVGAQSQTLDIGSLRVINYGAELNVEEVEKALATE
ncbi:MAG: endo-1,4-beta-xylanase [bacterium]|nr:endo-1,4-beta-xylanase [bacterium]